MRTEISPRLAISTFPNTELVSPPGVGPQRTIQLYPWLHRVPEKAGEPPPSTLQGRRVFLLSFRQRLQRGRYGGGLLLSWRGFDPQSGMFPCLRGGLSGRLVLIICSAWIRYGRVSRGSMTSST